MTDETSPFQDHTQDASPENAPDNERTVPDPAADSGEAPQQPDAGATPEESVGEETHDPHNLVGEDPYARLVEPVADPYEGAVPPGYDWPTHGGYLGCLLGVVMACVLGGFLGSLLIGLVSVSPLAAVVATSPARIAILLGIFLITIVGLGRIGWRLGRRFYREYPRPAHRTEESHRHIVR